MIIKSKRDIVIFCILSTFIITISSNIIQYISSTISGNEVNPIYFIFSTIIPLLSAPPVLYIIGYYILKNGEATRMYEELSKRDSLTNLLKRNHFFFLAEREIQKSYKSKLPLSLCLLDIDYFKLVNDNFGHTAGDLILKNFSELIIDNIRKIDVCSRFGGEEFAILLSNTGIDGSKVFASKIREDVEKFEFTYRDEMIHITVSIGVTTLNDYAKKVTLDSLISEADKALYQSKKNGRNRVTHTS